MRKILLVFILILTLGGTSFAQSGTAKTAFAEASARAREGKFQEALEKYRAVSVPEKESAFASRVHFNIGVCLYRLGQSENAIAEYQTAIILNAKYQKAFYALGMAYSNLRKFREAKEAFLKTVALNEKDGEAWFDLGMVLLEEKDYDSARAAFERVMKNASINSAEAINNIGVIMALRGDLAGAEEKFREALNVSRGSSLEARSNLRICSRYRSNFAKEMIAQLSFSGDRRTGDM